MQLVQFVEGDFNECQTFLSQGLVVEAEVYGLEALRCLASIAKGLQAPTDVPVDLDDTSQPNRPDIFWVAGDGSFIQQRIQQMLDRLITALPQSGDIVEAACSVFRAGFTEKLPGLFVFPPTSVADFIMRADPSTPRLGAVITTACSLVSSQTVDPSGAIDETLNKLLSWLLLILQAFQGRHIFSYKTFAITLWWNC